MHSKITSAIPFLLLSIGFLLGSAATAECVDSETTRCLRDGRFQLEVTWKDFEDREGVGTVVNTFPQVSDDSVLFYFFDPQNWEMLVKVLDGCSVTQSFWVFAASTTNVEFELTVTDTWTAEEKVYKNPLGVSADAITDTAAFKTCEATDPGT